VGAPDIKRPVRRSMWWLRRFFFVGLAAGASLDNANRDLDVAAASNQQA
jgi:hypothetical protein